MSAKDGYVIASAPKEARMTYGYDGIRFDPQRRISIQPYKMLLMTRNESAEAMGVLMTIFLRYWSKDTPATVEHLSREHRIPKRRMGEIIARLETNALVCIEDGGIKPCGSFGADPDEDAPGPRRPSREMPDDWIAIREDVFRRDGYGCVYCGSSRNLHCDHVQPLALGGTHDLSNLVTACAACNLSKGAKTVAEWRPHLAAALAR